MRERTLAPAVIAGLLLAGFALVFRAFERSLIAPNFGPEMAAFLTWTTLGGAVLFAALLLIGTRTRKYSGRELWKAGAIWALLAAAAEGVAAGTSGSLAADFDLARGGLFGLLLLLCLTAPSLLGLLQRRAL
jgi:hypothetical protein